MAEITTTTGTSVSCTSAEPANTATPQAGPDTAPAPPIEAPPPPPRRRLRGVITASRVRRVSSLVALAALWEINARVSQNRLTPPIAVVLETLFADIASGELWFHARLTLFRGFSGLAIALILGVAVGFAMARSRWIDAAVHPLLVGVYPVPKLALYPVTILILGFGAASKIGQVGLECFFPIAYNAYAGAAAIDRNLLWLSKNTGASTWRTTKDVIFPAALPAVLTGLRIATPIMLIVITVTELLGESRGLGFLIRDAQARFIAERAIAVVVVLGVLGFVLDRLLVWITRKVVFWEKGVQL